MVPDVTGRADGVKGRSIFVGKMPAINHPNRAMIAIGWGYTGKLGPLAVQRSQITVCDKAPVSFHIGHETHFEHPVTVVESGYTQGTMVMGKLGREFNIQEGVSRYLSAQFKLKITPFLDLYRH